MAPRTTTIDPPPTATVYTAKTTGVLRVGGVEYTIVARRPYPADHPLVKAHPDLFEPMDGSWITATAAPGERRGA